MHSFYYFFVLFIIFKIIIIDCLSLFAIKKDVVNEEAWLVVKMSRGQCFTMISPSSIFIFLLLMFEFLLLCHYIITTGLYEFKARSQHKAPVI